MNSLNAKSYSNDFWKFYKEAKEMEKGQIMEAYDKGESPFADNGKYLHGIDYYNETYGQ
jgi:hypothetical protein